MPPPPPPPPPAAAEPPLARILTSSHGGDVEAPLPPPPTQQQQHQQHPSALPLTPCSLGRRTLTGKLLVRDEPLPPVPALEDEHQDVHVRAFLSPPETFAHIATAGADKKRAGPVREGVLSLLAGGYIALGFSLCCITGGQLSPTLRIENPGLFTLTYAAFGFPMGLTICVVAGASLFTSNVGYMAASFFERRASFWSAVRVCAYSYVGNALGALFLAQLYMWAQVFTSPEKGSFVLELASKKTGNAWGVSFTRGILCNYLVVLAIWLANAAQDVASKAVAIFLPISAFVALGFEHCIANLWLLPLALMLQEAPRTGEQTRAIAVAQLEAAHKHHQALIPAEAVASAGAPAFAPPPRLTVGRIVARNLVPVTLGNIVGGAVFVATAYAFAYGAPGREADAWVERQWAMLKAAVRRRWLGKRGGAGSGGGGGPSGAAAFVPSAGVNGFLASHGVVKQRGVGGAAAAAGGGGGVRKDGSASALLPAGTTAGNAAARVVRISSDSNNQTNAAVAGEP